MLRPLSQSLRQNLPFRSVGGSRRPVKAASEGQHFNILTGNQPFRSRPRPCENAASGAERRRCSTATRGRGLAQEASEASSFRLPTMLRTRVRL